MVINWMFFNHFYQVSAVEGSCVKSVKVRAPWQCPTTGPSDFPFLNSLRYGIEGAPILLNANCGIGHIKRGDHV